MNGAESLVHTLLGSGVDTCFANPGTSEMHFVAALDRVPGMRCVLGLFEGVVTGAADGYARIAGKPAATLLHCGPGLANGLANLHNARRASSMIVNCVGDQATFQRPLDPPLTATTAEWAQGVSGWVETATTARAVGGLAAVAVQAATAPPGQIATLILPSDTCWNEGGEVAKALPRAMPKAPSPEAVRSAADILRRRERTVVLIGNDAVGQDALAQAGRIAAASGATVLAPWFTRRMARGRDRHTINRLPTVVDQAIKTLAGVQNLILVGARSPVNFFAYPGKPNTPVPNETNVVVMSDPDCDQLAALTALADALGAPPAPPPSGGGAPTELATGAIKGEAVAQSLAALIPEDAIIADESVTFGRAFFPRTQDAAPHDWLTVPGGAIGGGMPMATGAAVAGKGRRVINLQADGSAMYTVQALWTQAREKLDITTVIFSNRKYAILLAELANVGANPGRTALDMLDLGNPDLDFVRLANGMGVPGARADDMAQFNDLFAQSLKQRGPFLIELVV